VAVVGKTVAVSVTLVPEVGVAEDVVRVVVVAVPVEEESTVTVTELEVEAV